MRGTVRQGGMMISSFIVIASVTLAAGFAIAWLLRPGLRRRIEDPKFDFQRQLQAYNQRVQESHPDSNGGSDESV